MKKLVALMLALILCLSLAACGAKEETGAKIAVQKGTTSFMYADALKNTTTTTYDTFALAAKDMINGNADYLFVDKTTAKALQKEITGLKIIEIALSSENYGIGIDKNQADLKTKIDQILTDKADEINAIKEKYMNGEEDKYVGVTSATKDGSKADQQLVVATNAEFAPWEYKEGTEFYGIDMEIAKLFADELGLELVIDDMEFDAVVGAVGKQNVDIAMSGITITTERLQVINFSEPYYTESIVCVVKDSNTELDAVGTVVDMLNVICKK
ncbi:MAG: transporter substrate-binding domain-containing protein [Oscillospiraceae bacterium]|nr:transporter substrate-binding domain-containing protein [Oscillospiraceae bacterium]